MDEHDLREALTWLAGHAPDTGGLTEQVDRLAASRRARQRRYALAGVAAAVVVIAGTVGGLTQLGGSPPTPATGPAVISGGSATSSAAASTYRTPVDVTRTRGTSPAATISTPAGTPTSLAGPGTTRTGRGLTSGARAASAASTAAQTTNAPGLDGIHPASCAATNGASWHTRLLTAPDAPAGEITGELELLGIDGHGGVVAIEQTRPNRILRIVPTATTPGVRDVYTAPAAVAGQGQARIGDGMVAGDWAVFSIVTGGGQGAASGIEAVNTVTGAERDVRDTSLGNQLIVSAPIVVQGVVYWSEVTNTGGGHIYAYDLGTGARHTLTSGAYADPFTVGGGVYWFGPAPKQVVTYRRGALPPGYTVDGTDRGPTSVFRDGTLLAWNQGTRIMARNGSGPAVTVADGSLAALTDGYLIYSQGAGVTSVLDLRTGATLTLPQTGQFGLPAAAGAGIVALSPLSSHGGSNLAVATVKDLPRLRC